MRQEKEIEKILSLARDKIAKDLEIIDKEKFILLDHRLPNVRIR